MKLENTRSIVVGALVLVLIVVVFLSSREFPTKTIDNETVGEIPACVAPPPKPSVFCLTSKPEPKIVSKKYFVTLDFNRKNTHPTGSDVLLFFTDLDDFRVSGLNHTYPSARNYVYSANVSGIKRANITLLGVLSPVRKFTRYKGEPFQLENWVMVVQQQCVEEECEEFELYK